MPFRITFCPECNKIYHNVGNIICCSHIRYSESIKPNQVETNMPDDWIMTNEMNRREALQQALQEILNICIDKKFDGELGLRLRIAAIALKVLNELK